MALSKASLRRIRHHPGDSNEMEKFQQKLKLSTDFDENSEYADLAEKIVNSVDAVFDRDELLDEFDIIPTESKANHSPVLHDYMEHKLALESWCVPYLYTHSYKSFLAIKRKLKPSYVTIHSAPQSQYGNLKASQLSESEKISRGILLSRVLVLLNPDLVVGWNFRREHLSIVSSTSQSQNLKSELRLVNLVATRKPKCPEGFAYRRYLVEKAMKNGLLPTEAIADWIMEEVAAIELPIIRYFSNYHAWSYRLWLIQTIMNHCQFPSEQKQLILKNESTYSKLWMNTHVSDYCGHHFRQKLFQMMTEFSPDPDSSKTRLRNELIDNAKRLTSYEGHETLWYHRRAIIHDIIKQLNLWNDINATKSLLEEEQILVTKVLSKEGKSSDESSDFNSKLCRQYVSWINQRFKWKLNTELDL